MALAGMALALVMLENDSIVHITLYLSIEGAHAFQMTSKAMHALPCRDAWCWPRAAAALEKEFPSPQDDDEDFESGPWRIANDLPTTLARNQVTLRSTRVNEL